MEKDVEFKSAINLAIVELYAKIKFSQIGPEIAKFMALGAVTEIKVKDFDFSLIGRVKLEMDSSIPSREINKALNDVAAFKPRQY